MSPVSIIPWPVIWAFAVAALLTTVFPVILLVVLMVKKKISVMPMFVGFAAFFISQMVLRMPLLGILGLQSWYVSFANNFFYLYIVLLSFSAGLFEESARLIGAKAMKRNRSFKDAVSFGLGHGLCEVIVLVGLSYVSNTVYAVAINLEVGGIVDLLPAASYETIVSQLSAVGVMDLVAGILERVSAVSFHVFASVLVFKAVRERKIVYYFLAMLAHTVFNVVGVLVAQFFGIWPSEAAMFVLAALALWYVMGQSKIADAPDAAAYAAQAAEASLEPPDDPQ